MDGSPPAGFVEARAAFTAADPATVVPILSKGRRFRVRALQLAPGQATALQSLLHRSQHWVLIEGTAEITLHARARLAVEGEAVHIPLGQPHRIRNPGRLPSTDRSSGHPRRATEGSDEQAGSREEQPKEAMSSTQRLSQGKRPRPTP